MKKLSFVFVTVILIAVLSSCQQPPKQGGEQYASPSQTMSNQSDQPVIGKADSSIEKAVQAKNLEDSVLNGKK